MIKIDFLKTAREILEPFNDLGISEADINFLAYLLKNQMEDNLWRLAGHVLRDRDAKTLSNKIARMARQFKETED